MTSPGYYDLLELLPEPGCAVCRLLKRDVARYLDTLMYEFVLDPGIQRKFRASRGLCSEHGHQLTHGGNVLGIAALYFAVISDVIDAIDDTPLTEGMANRLGRWRSPSDGGGARLANALEADGVCMTCRHRDESEARYLREIAEHLETPTPVLIEAYRHGDGLCLPHFRALLRVIPSAEAARRVTAIQRDHWARLKDELDEFMRKSDYTNADERMGTEGDSWRRVVERLGGEPGVFGVQHKR